MSFFYFYTLLTLLFKERLLEKHPCIVLFVKLKMFRQKDNKEQDVSIIDSSITKHIFFSILAYWDFFAYICLFRCSKYEYLSYSMNFLFNTPCFFPMCFSLQ